MSTDAIMVTETSTATAGDYTIELPAARPAVGFFVLTIYAWGTFDAGSGVKLQTSPDGVEWFDHPDAEFTAKGSVNITVGGGIFLRALTLAGTTFSLNMSIST